MTMYTLLPKLKIHILINLSSRLATKNPQKIAKKEAAAGCHHWRTNIHSFVKTGNAQLNSYPVACVIAQVG